MPQLLSNHHATYGIMNFYTTKKIIQTYKIRNFKNISEESINEFANSIHWNFFSYDRNIDIMIDRIYEILNKFLDEICPLQLVKSRYKPVPWMNNEIKGLMVERKGAYDLWVKNRKHPSAQTLYKSYIDLSGRVKHLIRQSKRESFIDEYDQTDDLKERWNLIHKFGITSKSKKMEAQNTQFDEKFTVDKLNEHFVQSQPLPKHNLNLAYVGLRFDFDMVTNTDIRRAFSKITSNATGPDGIPPKCYKLLADFVSEPLSIIINASFLNGYFPNRLKIISVTPIPKIENPTLFSQFRPISNANFLLKVFSTISCEQLTKYAEGNNILSENQSGFRSNHSCTTAILKLTEDIHKSISCGKCVILVLLDFTNAFGSVDHDRLMQCLKSIGVGNQSMQWYRSFISGWQQIVKRGDTSSEQLPIKRGIIQGENNSQLFFSIFINNLEKYISHCKFVLFADDSQIYIESDINEIDQNIKLINDDLKNIESFCRNYGIDINASKTKAIIISSKNNLYKLQYQNMPTITINENKIEYVNDVRDLGYQINRTLTSCDHIKVVQRKVLGSLNSLYPLKSTLPPQIKLKLYKTLILPIFDYVDVIYHNYGTHGSNGESNKLEYLQNACIRYISNINRRDHITPHRESLKLLTLYDRRSLHIASMTNKILNNETPQYLRDLIGVNTNNTRSRNKLVVRTPKNNFHKTSYYISAPTLWNEIPEEIRAIKENSNFKEYLYEFMLKKT